MASRAAVNPSSSAVELRNLSCEDNLAVRSNLLFIFTYITVLREPFTYPSSSRDDNPLTMQEAGFMVWFPLRMNHELPSAGNRHSESLSHCRKQLMPI
jgi:hypothetical protein